MKNCIVGITCHFQHKVSYNVVETKSIQTKKQQQKLKDLLSQTNLNT